MSDGETRSLQREYGGKGDKAARNMAHRTGISQHDAKHLLNGKPMNPVQRTRHRTRSLF